MIRVPKIDAFAGGRKQTCPHLLGTCACYSLSNRQFLPAFWPHTIRRWLFSAVARCRSTLEDPRNSAEVVVLRSYAQCSKRVRVPPGARRLPLLYRYFFDSQTTCNVSAVSLTVSRVIMRRRLTEVQPKVRRRHQTRLLSGSAPERAAATRSECALRPPGSLRGDRDTPRHVEPVGQHPEPGAPRRRREGFDDRGIHRQGVPVGLHLVERG